MERSDILSRNKLTAVVAGGSSGRPALPPAKISAGELDNTCSWGLRGPGVGSEHDTHQKADFHSGWGGTASGGWAMGAMSCPHVCSGRPVLGGER